MLVKKTLEYQDKNVTLQGFYVFDDSIKTQLPLILVAHDWSGRNEFAMNKAEELAKLGFVGFALDMYGEAKVGQTKEEKIALMSPLKEDRKLLRGRIQAGLEAAKTIQQIDKSKIAAIGFCFGGLCVLDLARSGADIQAAVSFHGLLTPPNYSNESILAKILVLHGHDDPSVSPEEVLAFEKEMTKAKVDWQVHVYSNTMHGFTNPLANDAASGIVYNPCAAKRSWLSMQNLFAEIFL